MPNMDGIAYADAVMKNVYQSRTVKELSKTVSEGSNVVAISGNLLFDHLVIVLERKQEMEPYFEFELPPVPCWYHSLTVRTSLKIFVILNKNVTLAIGL